MRNKNKSVTMTNAEEFERFFINLPEQGSPQWFCAMCGILIEGPVYCDGGFIEINHGGGQCKECYLKSGHRECPCGAFLTDNMKFCHQCGKSKNKELSNEVENVPIS